MTTKNKKYIFAAITILVAGFIFYNYYQKKNIVSDPRVESLAKCLREKGVKMYGAYWCPHCQRQKDAFGSSWDKINYIECSLPNRQGQTQICAREKILGYPTWEFPSGERVSGEMSMDALAEKSKCEFFSS